MSKPINEIAPFDSFDCDGEQGPWDDLRDEPRARYYAKIVADVKERLGCPDLDKPVLNRRNHDESDY